MSMSKRLVAATKVAGTMVAEELVAAGAEGVGGAMAEAIFIGGLATARFAQTAIWGAPPDLAPEEDAGTLVPTIGGIVVPFGLSKCTADRDTSVTTWDISAEVFDLREHRLKLARPMLSTHDPLIALKMVDTLHVIDVSDSDPGAWKIDHQGDTSISDQVPSPRLIDIPMATMREQAISTYMKAKISGQPDYAFVSRCYGSEIATYRRLIVPISGSDGMVLKLAVAACYEDFNKFAA